MVAGKCGSTLTAARSGNGNANTSTNQHQHQIQPWMMVPRPQPGLTIMPSPSTANFQQTAHWWRHTDFTDEDSHSPLNPMLMGIQSNPKLCTNSTATFNLDALITVSLQRAEGSWSEAVGPPTGDGHQAPATQKALKS